MTEGLLRTVHHRVRPLRRTALVIIILVAFTSVAGGLFFLATPPASAAAALVAAQARRHGIAYPSPRPPWRFTEALVATEDHRFYSPLDPGIDPFAVARVLLGRITGREDQGGSTIEQQLAKMLYTPGKSGLLIEAEQFALAIKLDLAYSKTKILSMYAEVAYFGDGYYGLRAASCGYFGRAPQDLTWAQAAMLAGVVNAPSADDPRTHPERAHGREAHVFARLAAAGYLSKQEANAALSHRLGLVPRHVRTGVARCSVPTRGIESRARPSTSSDQKSRGA